MTVEEHSCPQLHGRLVNIGNELNCLCVPLELRELRETDRADLGLLAVGCVGGGGAERELYR